jgi:putative ABC transport system permease protein
METVVQDLRFGLRMLAKHRAFAAAVVVTLGLGIGVNTLVFGMADLVAFRPLPIHHAEGVASMWLSHPDRGIERIPVSYADFADWRRQATSFQDLSARQYASYNLTGVAEPTRVIACRATASLFRVWGLRAVAGRFFTDAEDRKGAPRVAVLSHGFWERQFGSQSDIIGRTVRLDGEPYEVVGVLTPEIEIGGLSTIDVWTPLGPDADPTDRNARSLRVDGRLKQGVDLEQAGAEMRTIVARLAREHPASNAGYAVRVVSLRQSVMGPQAYQTVALLSLTVVFVLAIACGNVASLTLARNAARERETAVRTALGAGRLRVARQLLTEGTLLALGGAALGVAMAAGGLALLRAVSYERALQQMHLDVRMLVFAGAVSLLTPLLFGLVPALQATRASVVSTLRDSGSRSATARGGRGRRALVVVQLALALTLLVVAGLSTRTAIALQAHDMGFIRRGLVTMRLDLTPVGYASDERVRQFVGPLVESLAASPGALGAAATSSLPVVDNAPATALAVEGQAPAVPGTSPWAARSVVTDGYFRTLGMAVVSGRGFEAGDSAEAVPVAVASRAFARRYFGDGTAIGHRIRVGADTDPWLTIVGVVEDVQNPNFAEPPLPQVYLPFAQHPERSLTLVVRTAREAATIAAARAEVARLDPDQALWQATSMEQLLDEELSFPRLLAGMFGAFGAVALLLAAIGLYGVISYAVSQRTREIGVRMALGAGRSDVLRLVARQGLALIGTGLVLGLAGGLGIGHAMRGLLIGVGPTDPITIGGVGALLGAVALSATLVPALRATRLDPTEALRAE